MAETSEAIADAIRAHVAVESPGSYVTGWVLIAAAAMPDEADTTVYVSECSDGPFHQRLGLVRYLALRTEKQVVEDDDD